jgi:hypothetical protein
LTRPDGALHEVTSVELLTEILRALRDRSIGSHLHTDHRRVDLIIPRME